MSHHRKKKQQKNRRASCGLLMFSINKWKTNEASSADGWMKSSSSFWWAAGWWLPAAPSSGISFYGELNRASTHVFLERLALTFRLIITHNRHNYTLISFLFFFSFSLSHTPESRHFSRFVLIFKHFSASQKKTNIPNGNLYLSRVVMFNKVHLLVTEFNRYRLLIMKCIDNCTQKM